MPCLETSLVNQICYYLKFWPDLIVDINMKEKMLARCYMISLCILINITSSLVRQSIPGFTPCPTAGSLRLSPQPSSFLITPKRGILIKINCIPWNPGFHLPVLGPCHPTGPWEYQINPGKALRWLPGRRKGALESSTELCNSNAGWGVTLMDLGNLSEHVCVPLHMCVCVCVCVALSPCYFMYYAWVAAGSDRPASRNSRVDDLSRLEGLVAMWTTQRRMHHTRSRFPSEQ